MNSQYRERRHQRLFIHIGFISILVAVFTFVSLPVAAQGQFNLLSVVTEDCRTCGACSFCDLLSVLTKGMRFMISVSGALALAVFIYGGVELILSQGKPEGIERGKKMISGTVVGMAIILLLAWVWPNWVILALKGVPADNKPATIFSSDAWWLTPCLNFTEQNQGKLCENEPERMTKEFANITGGCTKADSTGRPVLKPAGSSCITCEGGSPCVCSANGICIKGCHTKEECIARNPGSEFFGFSKVLNYCKKVVPGQSEGICVRAEPAKSGCTNDDQCPDYIFGREFTAASGSRSGSLGNTKAFIKKTAKMFCEKVPVGSPGVCRIGYGEPCENSTQCAEGGAAGICYKDGTCRKRCSTEAECTSANWKFCKEGVCQ